MDGDAWGLSTLPAWQVKPKDSPTMDPQTLALINAGSNVLGRALSPASAPSRAESQSNPVFNSSGWSVDFGPGSASATGGGSPLSFQTVALLAGVALVGFVAWAKFKK